jgi:dTDP-4-dehydrorhamnose reductase
LNARGPANLARAAERIGARVYHVSTDYVFDGEKRTPYTETDVTGPLGHYGRSKLEGERLVLEEGRGSEQHLVIRTSWLYGRCRTNFVDKTVENARSGKPIYAVTEQVSCPTWTYDLAQKIAELVQTPARGVLHIANGGFCSRYEMARYTLDRLGLKGDLVATTWEKINPPAKRPVFTAMTSVRLASFGVSPLRAWQPALDAYLAQRYSS